jgi:hypothetical protein
MALLSCENGTLPILDIAELILVVRPIAQSKSAAAIVPIAACSSAVSVVDHPVIEAY